MAALHTAKSTGYCSNLKQCCGVQLLTILHGDNKLPVTVKDHCTQFQVTLSGCVPVTNVPFTQLHYCKPPFSQYF